MNLTIYRQSQKEKERSDDLVQLTKLIADNTKTALDVGARDGHFSQILVEHFANCTALDLQQPSFEHTNVNCVQGDVTDLDFSDNSFELVFCAEVLEHIPPQLLSRACAELTRVSKSFLLIGVPYKQDIRLGRTTCNYCGSINPPWGHVNSFDEERLVDLFPSTIIRKISFVGETNARTNFISSLLMDLAGNPYGTYSQEEACVHCDKKLTPPPERNLLKKILTRAAFIVQSIQEPFNDPHPNWIHILFEKTKK